MLIFANFNEHQTYLHVFMNFITSFECKALEIFNLTNVLIMEVMIIIIIKN